MNMTYIWILALLVALFPATGSSTSCVAFEGQGTIRLEVTSESIGEDLRKYFVAGPKTVAGYELAELKLWVGEPPDGDDVDLILPLEYKVESDQIHAEFIARSSWRYVMVWAKYGKSECSPSLEEIL